jgi:phosphatidylserine/phosphatidylglycerophosphate/cardiolipin synthase-like enzyme
MNAGRSLWLLLSLVTGVTAALLWGDTLAETPATKSILIESVLFDGYALDDADEAVRLANAGSSPVNIGGWQLSDGGTSVTVLPMGVIIQPDAALWLTRDAEAFRFHFGRDADLELAPWPGFANAGDEVLLFDAGGAPIDALVYGDGNVAQPGWGGAAVQSYLVSGVFGEEGQILYRRRDQTTGKIVADTDRSGDWAQSPADVINGRKVRYPGWEGERFFFPPEITATAALTIAVAPDNAYTAIVQAIDSARTSIHLVSLTLENVALGEALAAAARRGVAVTALLEGGPPGGLTDQERFVCQLMEGAGGACWFMTADSTRRIHDRYRYLHAKYIVIDGRIAIVGSENFSPDSLPYDDKSDGTWGRRGVFLMTDAPAVAAHLEALFAADLDTAHPDLTRWMAADPIYGAPPPGFLPNPTTGGVTYTVRFPEPVVFYGTFPFEIIQSPENSLRDTDALLGLIGRAGEGDRLYVQQLNERPYWGATTSNPAADPNPRLEAYLSAARRGAVVRIMLDAFFDDAASAVSNAATCAAVNEIAASESLPLRCELGNPTGLGIHNKMVLAQIDGEGYVHVGSINGTEISHKGNRELALQVQSDSVYTYLVGLFLGDATQVVYLPLAAKLFKGAVDRVLISEIVYDTPGPDEAEFVELVNPTGAAVDLSGYALGDAVLPTDFEDMRHFPPGAIIPAHGTAVVALSGVAFREEFGLNPDLEIVDSDPAVPDMIDDPNWGNPEALFQLGNSGDEVLLIRWDGIVDVVTYGDGGYPGVVGCALLVAPAQSLERYPYWNDTDVCPVDFRVWPFPSPGKLP